MTGLALEISDTGLVLAREREVLEIEPAYAMVTSGGGIVTGEAARAQARLRPRQVSSRHWSSLSLEPGSAGVDGSASAAELALAQLEAIWRRYEVDADSVLLVVPGSYRREQLGVLLGLAQECGMPVHALVDGAAAASARPYPGHQLVHLDAGMHRVSVTRLAQSAQEVAADAVGQLEDIGLAALDDHLARRVAELFVIGSRFDPLHEAESEQMLYERLPQWLAALNGSDRLALELEHRGETFRVEVDREDMLAAVRGFYRALVQLVSQSREPDAPLVVQVAERLTVLPGLRAELLRMERVQVVPLTLGEGALGALASAALLPRDDQVRLVKRLPWRQAPAAFEAVASVPERTTSPRVEPTHIVHGGIAHRVRPEPLVVGRELGHGQLGIEVAANHTGVSRRHCELFTRNGELVLVDHSRFGTFVNERRVAGETVLGVGDVIRVGSPGELLTVIAVKDSHGAP